MEVPCCSLMCVCVGWGGPVSAATATQSLEEALCLGRWLSHDMWEWHPELGPLTSQPHLAMAGVGYMENLLKGKGGQGLLMQVSVPTRHCFVHPMSMKAMAQQKWTNLGD